MRADSPYLREAGLRTRMFSSFDRRSRRRDRDWFADATRATSWRTEMHGARVKRCWPTIFVPADRADLRRASESRLRVYLDGRGGARDRRTDGELPLRPRLQRRRTRQGARRRFECGARSGLVSRTDSFARRVVVTYDEPPISNTKSKCASIRAAPREELRARRFRARAAARLEAGVATALSSSARSDER